MNYAQTIEYLYTRLPMFSRLGASAIKKDLGNTLKLCSALGNPHKKFKSIHVAGTNGKGSVSHMLAAVLQTAGYKTGLYTSPHLKDFRERIRVNGKMIGGQNVVDFVTENQPLINEIQPSFFELTVAMAFAHFAEEKVDVAVIETGLGGRLDSTNIITPVLSVITNIGHDHQDLLGDTLEKIAGEKAGIIKQGVPAVIGEKQEEIAHVFREKAAAKEAPILFASDEWTVTENDRQKKHQLDVTASRLTGEKLSLGLDLTGRYQLKNLATALSALFTLKNCGFFLQDEHITSALGQVQKLTGLQGRWHVLANSPLTIADTGHNPEGIREISRMISATPHKKLHFVLGMVNDKDHSAVLKMLPPNAEYYFCRPNIPRGFEVSLLHAKAESLGLQGKTYPSVKEALKAAQANASFADLIFVGGSTFVVAEVV